MHHLDPRHLVQQFTGQVRRRAIAGRAAGQFAGVRFGVGQQLVQRFEAVVGAVHDQGRGDDGKARDRFEVAGRVTRGFIQPVVGGLRAVGAIGQRVAVRIGARRDGRADVATRAGAVFHDDGLAQFARQGLGHEPRQRVATATRRERHHERDRVGGPGGLLRQDGGGWQGCTGGGRQANQGLGKFHACLLWGLCARPLGF
ncbi:hypothetical protein D3C73_1223310 [compost metagenome]